jgi:hypothetical protein
VKCQTRSSFSKDMYSSPLQKPDGGSHRSMRKYDFWYSVAFLEPFFDFLRGGKFGEQKSCLYCVCD